jgi:hypothetical protein
VHRGRCRRDGSAEGELAQQGESSHVDHEDFLLSCLRKSNWTLALFGASIEV